MLSLKPRQLTEEGIVDQLKTVLESCENEDFKTKKFVGLLHDHIPYQSGLKARLELMGKQGIIEQLLKLKKESNQSSKIEKIAVQFSKEYGFVYEECLKTLSLLSRAMSLNAELPKNASLKIVSAVQTSQGNFSKKHIAKEEPNVSNGLNGINGSGTVVTFNKNEQASGKGQTVSGHKKRFVRNKFNLWAYLLLIFAMPLGYYALNYNLGQVTSIWNLMVSKVTFPIYLDYWFTVTMVGTAALIVIPVIANWTFKLNVVSLYPLLIVLAEVILATLKPKFPEFYMGVQIMMGIGLWLSFTVLAFYSMRLPKGAKEYLSYKTLLPYYLSTGLWLLSQYIIFQNAMIGVGLQ